MVNLSSLELQTPQEAATQAGIDRYKVREEASAGFASKGLT